MNLNQNETKLVKDILAEVYGKKVMTLERWKEQKATDHEHIQELEEHIQAIKTLHERMQKKEIKQIKELFFTGRDSANNKRTLSVSEGKVKLSYRSGRMNLDSILRNNIISSEFRSVIQWEIADYNYGETSLDVLLCTVEDFLRKATYVKWNSPTIRYRTV